MDKNKVALCLPALYRCIMNMIYGERSETISKDNRPDHLFTWNPGDESHEFHESHESHDTTWDKYFMGIARLCEKRSKDVDRQVGACLVNDEPRLIGTGYNGMPLGCSDRQMPWTERGEDETKLKHLYVCHAELNAIVNKDPKSAKDCTLYVTLFPCNECAKVIVRSGIKRVIYLSDDKKEQSEFKASREILGKKVKSFKEHCRSFNSIQNPDIFNPIILKFQKDPRQQHEESSKNAKKEKHIPWPQFFMGLARLSGDVRSTSFEKGCSTGFKDGACVVNRDRRIVGLGYVDDSLVYSDEQGNQESKLYVVHAPVTAIVKKNPSSLDGCTMFVTEFPCNECAKVIVQSGIKKIVYLNKNEGKDEAGRHEATEKMFDLAHVKFEDYKKKNRHQEIHLDFIERK